MAVGDLFYRGAQPKPPRGSGVLEREKADRERREHEEQVAKAVKKRDGRCRWPEAHKCRGELEAAHIVDKGMGGDHGLRTYTGNEITLCRWLHRSGPESIHGKQLKVEPLTPDGADGPCAFYRQAEDGSYYVVAQERAIGIIDKD